ncbi:MAG TPA: hypothetical protein VJ553_02195, partial [Candidatus Paceibacterota bacterium]|nr:hypothetical protein [Candidatus Paceibacterota bacterium]
NMILMKTTTATDVVEPPTRSDAVFAAANLWRRHRVNDPTTVMSDAHTRVVRLLERRGVAVLVEIDFPPYRVDCYLPDFHAALEVDGPQHSERERVERDDELMRAYSLPVFHLSTDLADAPDEWIPRLREFLLCTQKDLDERLERRGMVAPWV